MIAIYVKIHQFGCRFGIYFYLCKKNKGYASSFSKRIKANEGQSVLLTSRYGNFKIVPISEEDNLTTRICRGLQQVKLIEEGKLPRRTIEDLLDEL